MSDAARAPRAASPAPSSPRLVDFYLQSRLLRALALIYVVGAAWVTCFGAPSETRIPPYRIDVDVYRLGGLAVLNGEPIYDQSYLTEIGASLPFTYPPIAGQIFAVIFAPISLPYATAALAVATAAALYAVVWLVLQDLTEYRGTELIWATVGVLVLVIALVPFKMTVGFGQINVFLMLLVLIDLTVGRDRWWRGSLIGLAAAVKLTPLAFGLYFLMRRDFRGGIQTLLAFGFWTLVGHLRSPSNSTIYWTQTLSNSGRIGAPDYASNQSVTGLLARTSISEGGQRTIWLVLVVVLGLITAAIMWLLIRRGHHLAAVLANAFFGLLASPVSWSHHWVWAIPALMWLVLQTRPTAGGSPVSPGGEARLIPARSVGAVDGDAEAGSAILRRPSWLPWVLAGIAVWGWWAFYYGPQMKLPNGADQEKDWTLAQDFLGNMWLWWTLVFLAALLVVALLDCPDTGSGPVFARQIPRVIRSRFGLSPTANGAAGAGAASAPADSPADARRAR